MRNVLRIGWIYALLLVLLGPGAMAQVTLPGAEPADDAPIDLSQPMTPEAANALIARLSDAEVRALLLAQLDTQSADEPGADGQSEFLYHATIGAYRNVVSTVEHFPKLVEGQSRIFAEFYQGLGPSGLAELLGYLALVLALAYGVELVFRRLIAAWISLPPALPEAAGLRTRLSLLTKRLIGQVGAVLVFIVAAAQIGGVLLPPQQQDLAFLIELYLIGIPRFAIALGRFILAPNNPAYRIVRASDATAKAILFHQFWFALLMGFSVAILDFNEMNGVMRGEMRLGFWINFFVHLYIAVIFWRYRDGMADMMRGHDPNITATEEWVAKSYPYFGIAVAIAIWWVVNIVGSYGNFAFLASIPHYKTMALALLAPALDTMIRGLVRHAAPPITGEGAVAERAHAAAQRSFIRIGRVLVFGLVLIAIAGFWGVTPTAIASAGVGPRFAASVIEFLIILSIGYLLYELVSLTINRKLAAEMTASGYDPEAVEIGGEGGGAGGSRLSTVLPLILMVSRTTIIVVFVLLALGNIGIDTTPLLAGAGIVGLAIGFGAQKLVTDVVSGIFFLIDDAFRTGEYVEVEGTMGTVERISIRSLQLRHHKGPVHTIPYSEIPKITNFSRDWVIMKLRFTVPFGTDPNKVKKIFKKIGTDMLEHPELGQDFLQPFKSQGVLEIDDVGMVIRGKFMAKPGKQFMIRKEVFNRVSKAFEEAGIDFARREVRVAIPGFAQNGDLSEEDKAAIAAAAADSAEALQPKEGTPEQR